MWKTYGAETFWHVESVNNEYSGNIWEGSRQKFNWYSDSACCASSQSKQNNEKSYRKKHNHDKILSLRSHWKLQAKTALRKDTLFNQCTPLSIHMEVKTQHGGTKSNNFFLPACSRIHKSEQCYSLSPSKMGQPGCNLFNFSSNKNWYSSLQGMRCGKPWTSSKTFPQFSQRSGFSLVRVIQFMNVASSSPRCYQHRINYLYNLAPRVLSWLLFLSHPCWPVWSLAGMCIYAGRKLKIVCCY